MDQLETIVREVREAADRLDREQVGARCRELIALARDHPEPLDRGAVVAVMGALQRKRYFDLGEQVGAATIGGGQTAPGVRRRYVQALIDQGKLDEAHAELDRLIPDTEGDEREHDEARGLRGRALKQAYVGESKSPNPGTADLLREAITTYYKVYTDPPADPRRPPDRSWHGINTVALLARARRDDVDAPPGLPSPEALAREILEKVESQGAGMDAWHLATGLEACVALGNRPGATRWANGYAAHPGTDAFELASTLRQLTEIWQLDATDGGMGAAVLPVLRSGLLRRENGSVEVSPQEVREGLQTEAVLGLDAYVSLTWYRLGLDRARAVARISRPMGQAAGTGFLVRGGDLAPVLGDEWVLLTNYHVVNEDAGDHQALRPRDVRVTFQALTGHAPPPEYRVEAVLASSPADQLDFALLRLGGPVGGVEELEPFTLADDVPDPEAHQRIYIIGHPLGNILSFSLNDNLLLARREPRMHYRAPTNPGSSGSPVFNREWELIGLHRAGGKEVERLDGPGTYAANEGIWIQSIRAAVRGIRPPPRATADGRRPSLAPDARRAQTISPRESKPMSDLEARLRAAVAEIERRDRRLREELEERRDRAARSDEARAMAESLPAAVGPGLESLSSESLAVETIVLRTGRPVLEVFRDEPRLEFPDAESEVWRERLVGARDRLVQGIRAVGRVEVTGHPLDWVGTAWLVADDVVVTNRHVAREFARQGGRGFVFRRALGREGNMTAAVDFLEELGRQESLAFRVLCVLHVEDDDGPDLALMQVEPADGQRLAPPIALARREAEEDRQVTVIGYPARDSRIPDQPLMDHIFGNVYDKKRLAPGLVTRVRRDALLHDCSTLGGNSGSVVFDLETGEAVGLHFAGRFLEANFAVPAHLVADRLARVGRCGDLAPAIVSDPRRERPAVQVQVQTPPAPPAPAGALATVTIPIQVTVTVGAPVVDSGASAPGAPPREEGDDPVSKEGRPEDYRDRDGYDPHFLGDGRTVPLPEPTGRVRRDVLTFRLNGEEEDELRYRHFSVKMSRSRRMCLFSAVNIDGAQERTKLGRPDWRFDPRIPREAQIKGECYGEPPRFSRGHMTRREDPAWGEQAEQGNADSMHVTNTTPQMQTFNAPVWLGLEDYALQNARKDDMRISVFTGPVLTDDDPVLFGVKIPQSFWKVIAFIHDETRELSATGYWISQVDHLPDQEMVFGAFGTAQRPISWIEDQTGLSFGGLADLDPLRTTEESLPAPLVDLSQIRFR